MTYYIAEIRFNRTNRNPKKDRRMRKRLTARLVTFLLVFLLFSVSIMIVSVVACRRKPPCKNGGENQLITESLRELSSEISDLPNEAFVNPCRARCQRKVLCTKVSVVIWQVKVGAYEGALNKLKNDIKEKIEGWIVDPWRGILLEKVEHIISLLEELLCWKDRKPPTIVTVLRYPETPNYDESVTVIAQVTDDKSGVKSVILSYHVDSGGWTNTTMNRTDGLYVAEIPPQPYDSNVNYKIYAYDWACNSATSKTYSYVVVDSYPPLISYVDRTPASPNYNQNVIVFANVTEPPEASGVKNVTLWYRTNSEWQPVEMTLNQLYTGIIPAYPYGTLVHYRVCAFDYAGNWAVSGVYSYTVGAPPNLPPVAIFTESAETVPIGVMIHFNASESYDPDGYIVSYFWNFGDGTNATGVIVDHAYTSSGTYTVTLKVTDNDGAVDFASSTKTVLPPNKPPVAIFTESATTVFTNEIIQFNASTSYDPDGTIVSYHWNFGDGNFATGVFVEHSYADNGAYTVTLTVTDDDGATDTATSTKYVLNRPPVANFTESAKTVSTGEIISFNASESYDPDGDIISYFWDFGDGTNATDVLLVEHAYADNGFYMVRLTVTDDDGSTATVNSIKVVLNRPPVSSFTVSAPTVQTGETVHFDASGSKDPDGHIICYIWNFGDGTSSVGVNVSHAYENNGDYTVTLTVIDDDGAASSISAVETVLNRPPVALFAKNVTIVKENEAIRFNASESHDPDGSIVSYFWDFGDGTNATGMVIEHAYAEDGNYTVTLTVTDDDGASSSVSATVTVKPPTPFPLALLAAIGLGIAALTATLLYALYRRRRKKGGSTANPGNKPVPNPVVTLYVPAKILSQF
ncbi:MAG: PKD domain-containing protein [Candidatus Bathyarchaeaceae archaeon]